MINKLVRKCRGLIIFSVIGAETGDFLTALAKQGFLVWNIQKKQDKIFCRCFCKDYKKIARIAGKFSCRCRIHKKQGLPFILYHYRFRKGLAIGVVMFLTCMAISTFFVWDVEVNGNYNIPTEEILETAEALGLKRGAFKYNLDYTELEQNLSNEFDGFAWISINRIGTHIYIEISEMVKKPEIVDINDPCNVVSKYDGVILEVQPYGGEAVVKEGDAVKQGDLLISGVIEDNQQNVFYYHAYGKVIARVEHTIQFEQELETERTYFTGETQSYSYLNLFGFQIPMFIKGAPDGAKLNSYQYSPVTLFGLELPFGKEQRNYDLYSTETVTLDEAGAKRMLLNQSEEWQEENLAGATILSQSQEFSEESGKVILTMTFTVEQDIGEQRQIYITARPESEENSSETEQSSS